MPDLFNLFARWWKFIFGFALVAAVVALIFCLISTKLYLGEATALPVNSMTADKARIFGTNIQELYSDFGTPDELDRIEGTAILDTIYIATVKEFNMEEHYGIPHSGESFYKAAMKLKKNSRIRRSGYGELKVKVWDKDRNLTAALSNSLLDKIQSIHQRLQNESNAAILQRLREDYAKKQQEFRGTSDSMRNVSGTDAEILQAKKTAAFDQLLQYEKMIDQYQLALSTNPPVLLVVEKARPPVWHDKPKTLQVVLLTFFAALAFAFLMVLFLQARRTT
ncbi:MAG TPA: hypothetical protein VFZ78_04900 [Flavisolibacter sp.]